MHQPFCSLAQDGPLKFTSGFLQYRQALQVSGETLTKIRDDFVDQVCAAALKAAFIEAK